MNEYSLKQLVFMNRGKTEFSISMESAKTTLLGLRQMDEMIAQCMDHLSESDLQEFLELYMVDKPN